MEMAEVLTHRGLEVTVLEKLDQVVPGYDPKVAGLVREELGRHGVRVLTGITVEAIEGLPEEDAQGRPAGADGLRVRTDRGSFPPGSCSSRWASVRTSHLAKEAGIALGETGAIRVDASMRTSAPLVFAAGDCAEAMHLVSGHAVWVPLGTTTNKTGRVGGRA